MSFLHMRATREYTACPRDKSSDVAVSVGEDGNGRLLLTAGARHAKDISGSQESSSLLSRDLDS